MTIVDCYGHLKIVQEIDIAEHLSRTTHYYVRRSFRCSCDLRHALQLFSNKESVNCQSSIHLSTLALFLSSVTYCTLR
jgi:hypothetical protein